MNDNKYKIDEDKTQAITNAFDNFSKMNLNIKIDWSVKNSLENFYLVKKGIKNH